MESYSGLMVVNWLTENRWNLAGNLAVMNFSFDFPYSINPDYKTPVAYFCMKYAIHQPLKTYAGGLGFLAGSHMRGAYALGQNIVGIGILWKYGYYDQGRKTDQNMSVEFREKTYRMLVDTGIKFSIRISGHPVWVTAFYLPPSVFKTRTRGGRYHGKAPPHPVGRHLYA